MSIYPKFNKNTNTFNSSNIISQEEVGNGSNVVTLDLSNFVQRNAAVFDDELYLKDGVNINMNGTVQTSAFDDTKKTDLALSKLRTSAMVYDENANRTTINDTLNLTSATLEINDEQIPQNKITNLVNRLSEIDANLANINSNDTDIANLNATTVTHSSRLDAVESQNGEQDVSLNEHKTEIQNIKLNILETETDITTNNTNISTNASSISTNLAIINGLNNDVINLQNMDTDLSANIATNFTQFSNYKTSNDASINQINLNRVTDRSDIAVNIVSIGAINTLNTAQDTRLDAIETLNTAQDTRLDAIETLNTAQDTRLDAIETSTSTNTSDISSLQALTTSHTNSISTINTNVASNDSDISDLQADVLTKHNIIDNSNRLNAVYLGNGDVSNDRLSSLNDIRTDVSIQNQINTLTTSIGDLDALQDIDLVNIPVLQSDVVDLKAKDVIHDASVNALEITTASNTTSINSNTANIASNTANIASNTTDIASNSASIITANNNITTANNNIATNSTNITANGSSISNINTSLTTLTNADTLHSSQISNLQSQDTTLQNNIDLKNDIIDETNKLNSSLIFDTSMNDTVNNLLETLDDNITTLDTNKQAKITTSNKLQSSLLNRNDNLSYVDVNSSIQSSLDTINSNISLLQGADTSIITDINNNFNAVDASLNAQQTSITNNANAISTLQGLQDGDVISFQTINNSITNLTNTKHPLIDTNNKLNSSLINRDDNLQHIDITSSLQTSLNNLQTNINAKNDIINNTTNKLPISNVDISTSNLQYADYGSSINDKFTSLDSQISTLSATDVSQLSTNTSLQNQINTNISDITALQNKDTQLDASLSDIITDIATNVSDITVLQNKDTQLDASLSDIITDIASNSTDITVLQNKDTQLDASLSDIITDIASNSTDIIALQNKDTQLDASLSDIITDIATNTSDITALQNKDTQLDASLSDIISDIATNSTNIDLKQNIIDVNNKLAVSNVDLTGSSLSHIDITSSLQTSLNNLQTNIDNIDTGGGNGGGAFESKIETIGSHTYNNTNNTITHTYDETTLHIDPLDDNNLMSIDLSINTPTNNKNYIQKLIINCLEFKSYVNTLNINGNSIEIKHKNGENINLAPISGYSMILQTLNILRENDEWTVMSNVKLFYNSASNTAYDITPPVIDLIELNGSININHELNSVYTDPGGTVNDAIDPNVVLNIDDSAVDITTLGVYTVYYSATDTAGNSSTATRTVNVIDTTDPLITLIGDSVINVNIGGNYVDEGVNISDNSNETINAVISGDTPDYNTSGTYVVVYTATDSNNNSASISRSIVVSNPQPTLQYSNPSQDIFQLADMFGLFGSYRSSHSTSQTATKTNGSSYLQGAYTVSCSNYRGDNNIKWFDSLFSNLGHADHGLFFEFAFATQPFNHHLYGNGVSKTGGGLSDTGFTGYNLSNGTNLINLNYNDTITTSGTKTGEWIQIDLPFYLKASKFTQRNNFTALAIGWTRTYLAGTNDVNGTWDYLGMMTNTYGTGTHHINNITTSSSYGYKHFRVIVDDVNGNRGFTENIFIYGDIYTF